MARILDLPNELIDHVLTCIWPKDFENFAQTCKAIRTLSFPFLTEHRNRIRAYSSFRDIYRDKIANLLFDVLSEPRMGHYVTSLDIHNLEPFRKSAMDRPYRYAPMFLDAFNQAMTDSDFFTTYRIVSPDQWIDWNKRMIYGDEDVLLTLLIPLLPNLSKISLPGHSSTQNCLQSMIKGQWIPSTSRLRTICLKPREEHELSIEDIVSCSISPGVRKLSITDMLDFPFTWLCEPNLGSNISYLELWGCQLNPSSLAKFLISFRLERFAYSCNIPIKKAIGCKSSSGLYPLHEALLAGSKFTLKNLKFFARGRQLINMRPMHEFRALEKIYTEWEVLVPEQNLDGRRCADAWRSHMLPASLRRLEVHISRRDLVVDFQKLVTHIVEAKATKNTQIKQICLTGHLAKVIFSAHPTRLMSMTTGCANVGIALETHTWKQHWGERCLIPAE